MIKFFFVQFADVQDPMRSVLFLSASVRVNSVSTMIVQMAGLRSLLYKFAHG